MNGQPEGMPWSQGSFVFRSYLGAFDPTATRLLRQVGSNVEDPVVVDNTSMTEVERRLSIQLFHVLALTCRGKSLQEVTRVPEGFGFEAWKQLCRESEPRLPSRFPKECFKPSWHQREWTIWCRQSINGRAVKVCEE